VPEPASPRELARSVATVYFGYFAALGVAGPFLAVFLEHRGLRPADAAYLLALLPLPRVLATPGWTLLADRLRSARAVLRIVCLGAMAAFAALELRLPIAGVVAALLLFTIFRSPATSLIDVLALEWVRRSGSEFGRIRAWGTVGFTVAIFGAGLLVDRWGSESLITTTVALLALTSIATLTLPHVAPPHPAPIGPALAVLLRRPRFVRFLATCALHQIGLAAYDNLFAAQLTALATPTHAGLAIAFGATAEVLFMLFGREAVQRLGLARTLAVAYAATALRWFAVAFVSNPVALILVQALHAFTFGAFYVAGVALVDRESPPEVRASAQGIFGAFTWGLASAVSLAIAGTLESRGGMRAVWIAATVASIAGAVVALSLDPPAGRSTGA
jgi:PPP family 3-phenylpropionic acid transporter